MQTSEMIKLIVLFHHFVNVDWYFVTGLHRQNESCCHWIAQIIKAYDLLGFSFSENAVCIILVNAYKTVMY